MSLFFKNHIMNMNRRIVKLFIVTYVCENAYSIENLMLHMYVAVKMCNPEEAVI